MHRMNGALNNASMALELALGDAAARDPQSDEMLRAALAAMAQASRAAALIAHLAHGRGAPPDPEGAYARDVQDILREHARSTGTPLPPEPASLPPDASAAQAVERLVAEVLRMQRGAFRA